MKLAAPGKYLVTLVIIGIATALQSLIWPYVEGAPYILFFPAIILASLYGDGLSAIVLAVLIAQFRFIPPLYSFSSTWPHDYILQAVFICSALMIRNITKALAQALARSRASEAQLMTTLTSIGDAVITTDATGRVDFINPVAEKLTQWTLAEAKGKLLPDVFHIVNSDSRERVSNPVTDVLRDGKIVELATPTRIIGRQGAETSIEDSAAPIRASIHESVQGVVLVFRDVQEKYSQQAKLDDAFARVQESEARIRSILENALDAVVGMDDHGLVTQWNSQAEAIFGFRREDAIGHLMSELIIPHRYREAHEHGMRHYLATGEGPVLNSRVEISALRKDGTEFPIELAITPIRTGATQHFAAFIRDISSRVEAEKALKNAVRARDEFISICSHELKTPITSMKLQFEMAERQAAAGDPAVYTQERVRRRIVTANTQLTRMIDLIEEMLDVSKIGAGRLSLRLSQFDLSALAQELVERFEEQFESSGSSLHASIEPGIELEGDHFRIEQVVSNLLNNTLKYSPGKPVSLSLKRVAENAVLTVLDVGSSRVDLQACKLEYSIVSPK